MEDLVVQILMVLVPATVVFIMALLGNLISFENRYVNAAVSAAVSSLTVAVLAAYWIRPFQLRATILIALFVACVVFIADLIGNWITFTSRFGNALAKAAVFAVPFSVLIYYLYPVLQAGL